MGATIAMVMVLVAACASEGRDPTRSDVPEPATAPVGGQFARRGEAASTRRLRDTTARRSFGALPRVSHLARGGTTPTVAINGRLSASFAERAGRSATSEHVDIEAEARPSQLRSVTRHKQGKAVPGIFNRRRPDRISGEAAPVIERWQ